MSAAEDGTLRLWTLGGTHVGTFTREEWRVGDSGTYGPTPATALAEPPATWRHPPRVPPPRPRPPAGGAEQRAEGTSFLTSIDDLEVPAAPAAPPPSRRAPPTRRMCRAGRSRIFSRPAGAQTWPPSSRRSRGASAGAGRTTRAPATLSSVRRPPSACTALKRKRLRRRARSTGMRPSSAALRQAVSMPALPPVGGSSLRRHRSTRRRSDGAPTSARVRSCGASTASTRRSTRRASVRRRRSAPRST